MHLDECIFILFFTDNIMILFRLGLKIIIAIGLQPYSAVLLDTLAVSIRHILYMYIHINYNYISKNGEQYCYLLFDMYII